MRERALQLQQVEAEKPIANNDLRSFLREIQESRPTLELSASVRVTLYVSVSFYVWDSIDKEEVAIGSRQYEFSEEIDVDAYLTCSAVELDTPPRQWNIDIDIAEGRYPVGGDEVEPDFGGDE